jgi:hypothetical protein
MPDALHFPWWLIVALAIAAVVCLYTASTRTSARMKKIALGLLALAALLGAIRIVFPTDIERVEQCTRDLCQSAVEGKWDRFTSLLGPDITVGVNPNPIFSKPDQVTAAARYCCEGYHVTTIKITGLQSTETGNAITTLCKLITIQNLPDLGDSQPIPSTWSMEWRRAGRQWLLDRVTLTELAGQPSTDFPDISRMQIH